MNRDELRREIIAGAIAMRDDDQDKVDVIITATADRLNVDGVYVAEAMNAVAFHGQDADDATDELVGTEEVEL